MHSLIPAKNECTCEQYEAASAEFLNTDEQLPQSVPGLAVVAGAAIVKAVFDLCPSKPLVNRGYNRAMNTTRAHHLWVILCGGLAGGLGWGIRGQYGHESGAMIAGLLVTSVIAVGYLSHLPGLFVARAMALATVAIGIGAR